MRELRGVPDTLFIPLAARVHVSRRFPDYFHDGAALSLARLIPAAVDASSSEYGHMASVARYHNLDEMTRAFAARRDRCTVVSLMPATLLRLLKNLCIIGRLSRFEAKEFDLCACRFMKK